MDTLEIILAVLGSNALNSILTWKFTKKKYNAEVTSNNIENMQKSLDFYINLSNDTAKRLDEVLHRNEELNNTIISLQAEIFEIYKYLGVQSKEELITLKETLIEKTKETSKNTATKRTKKAVQK